jgi:hypothetical protein
VGISRSSFYGGPRLESAENLALMRAIDEQFMETPWYGSRQMVRIPTKPDTESDRSRTLIRTIADSDPTKPDSATHRRTQRVTRQRPCQVCHA